ncbi:N-acetylmuramoyl-L-alanine amidase [Rhizobiales bacterium GAS113]|nr:N-acetylmuramoyl-L-alanine amidase [Rhizobiales bacterium GAS113]
MTHPALRAREPRGALVVFGALACMTVVLDGTAAMPAEQPAPRSCQPALFRVALDIGHDRAKPGAISATGVTEFEYNLSLGHAVIAGLRQAGFGAAFLVGESGTPQPIERRTKIAMDAGAVLLVSLHHDSVQPRYLSEWTVDGRLQHYSDNFHGYSVFISGKNGHQQGSKEFAVLLGEALLGQGLTPSLHHAKKIPGENRPLLDARLGVYRFNDLEVLKTASMPAVLLETGIIVNRKEEQEIRNGPYHKRIVAALVHAIRSFCSMHIAGR